MRMFTFHQQKAGNTYNMKVDSNKSFKKCK